jgi:hypothetical protein
MAKFSKQLWPDMNTLVRVVPSWLASSRSGYKYLDAGWAQYSARKGDADDWTGAEVRVAQELGLGLVVSLNILNGGNGSSRTKGKTRGQYAMSGSEILKYGSALLDEGYACAFLMWRYDSKFFKQRDVRAAMNALSEKAKNHPAQSCSQ